MRQPLWDTEPPFSRLMSCPFDILQPSFSYRFCARRANVIRSPKVAIDREFHRPPAICCRDKKELFMLAFIPPTVLSPLLSLLIFIGEAVRDAFDPRKTFQ